VRAAPALALAVLAALLVSGCGGIASPDLFVVTRTGSGPAAHLTLLVTEEGGVRCNGGRQLKLSDPQIVKARAIQEELQSYASRHLTLPARPNSVLHYELRDENGTVSFADNSAAQPAVLRQLVLFVLLASQQVCHLQE
jgi:hypothetical protein